VKLTELSGTKRGNIWENKLMSLRQTVKTITSDLDMHEGLLT